MCMHMFIMMHDPPLTGYIRDMCRLPASTWTATWWRSQSAHPPSSSAPSSCCSHTPALRRSSRLVRHASPSKKADQHKNNAAAWPAYVCACSMGLKGTSGKRAIGLAQICKCPGDTALKGLLLHWWHLHTVCALLTKALLLWQARSRMRAPLGPSHPSASAGWGVSHSWGLQGC